MRLKYERSSDALQEIALQFIGFLVADERRLEALMMNTGLHAQDFTTRAGDPQFRACVLDYALEHENLLLEFAAEAKLEPQSIIAARRKLPGAWI